MGVGAGLYMCDVVKKFTFAISSPDEFLLLVDFTVGELTSRRVEFLVYGQYCSPAAARRVFFLCVCCGVCSYVFCFICYFCLL